MSLFLNNREIRSGIRKLRRLRNRFKRIATRIAIDMLAPIKMAGIAQSPRDSGALAATIVTRRRKGYGAAKVGTTREAKYGFQVEWGTKGHQPDAFMMRAYDQGKNRAVQIAIKELSREVNQLLSS